MVTHLLNQIVYVYWQSQEVDILNLVLISHFNKKKNNLFLALDKWLRLFSTKSFMLLEELSLRWISKNHMPILR